MGYEDAVFLQINFIKIICQSELKCFIIFKIHYSYMSRQTWPSSSKAQRIQDPENELSNVKFYKKK